MELLEKALRVNLPCQDALGGMLFHAVIYANSNPVLHLFNDPHAVWQHELCWIDFHIEIDLGFGFENRIMGLAQLRGTLRSKSGWRGEDILKLGDRVIP